MLRRRLLRLTRRKTFWLNDYEANYDEDEAFAMVMSLAEGSSRSPDIPKWFADRVHPATAGGST